MLKLWQKIRGVLKVILKPNILVARNKKLSKKFFPTPIKTKMVGKELKKSKKSIFFKAQNWPTTAHEPQIDL